MKNIGRRIIDVCLNIIKERDIVNEDSDETPSLKIVYNAFSIVLQLQTQKEGVFEIVIRDLNDYI